MNNILLRLSILLVFIFNISALFAQSRFEGDSLRPTDQSLLGVDPSAKILIPVRPPIPKVDTTKQGVNNASSDIQRIYVVALKDEQGNPTGKYFKIACAEGQTYSYAQEQAKLLAGGENFTVQSMSVQKGKYGVLTKSVDSDGKIHMYYSVFKSKEEADANVKKVTQSSRYPRELLEIITLKD